MPKYEKIVRIPAGKIARESAQHLAGIVHELAERRVTNELADRLRAQYRHQAHHQVLPQVFQEIAAATEHQFVANGVQNEALRNLIRPGYEEKYTFLSDRGIVQFLYEDFSYDDIPTDVHTAIIEAQGPNGEIFVLNAQARPQYVHLADPNFNRILIQGSDRAWVNDTDHRVQEIVIQGEDPWRHFLYRGTPICVGATFFALTRLEFKAVQKLTGFDWRSPFDGLTVVSAFIVMALTLIASLRLFEASVRYLFPFFELEGKLSNPRKTSRWFVMTAAAVIYGAALTSLFHF